MTDRPDQTENLPQLPAESARAYRARMLYVTMGADRSMARVRDQIGKRSVYDRQLEEWSTQYSWRDHARAWDAARAGEVAAARSATTRSALMGSP